MRYLVSRKRFIKGKFDVFDINSYKNILDEFKKFVCEPDTVCCYDNDNDKDHEGLKVIKLLQKYMTLQMFDHYTRKIYECAEFYDSYENVSDILISIPILIKTSKLNYFDIFGGFRKILKCEIMYEITGTYMRFIIEDDKTEAPSLLEQYSITNRMS